MFSLLTIEDKILLDPSLFAELIHDKKQKKKHNQKEQIDNKIEINKYSDIVYLKLREKYISKIIIDHGLVVSIKNFKINSDLIVEIEGVVDIKYECNLIMFSPREGDILYGTIFDSNQNSIIVNCGIIKVKVPTQQLMDPYYFNKKEKLWFWSYDGKNYYYEKNAKCRLKVLDVNYKSGKDISKLINDKMAEDNEGNIKEEDLIKLKREDIMEIYCTMSQEGLGPIKWWE
jgi:DNA-directed RNA polymerase subunit E'/Rpb7